MVKEEAPIFKNENELFYVCQLQWVVRYATIDQSMHLEQIEMKSCQRLAQTKYR